MMSVANNGQTRDHRAPDTSTDPFNAYNKDAPRPTSFLFPFDGKIRKYGMT